MDLKRTILRYLHSVFDTDPEARLALRIRHVDGCVWAVAGETLSLTAGTDPAQTFSLASGTIGALAVAVETAGFTIEYLDPDLQHRAAFTLLDGSGSQETSNGDHITAFDSVLWAILGAIDKPIQVAGNDDLQAALQQLVFMTAGGKWLDLWGSYFGVPRPDGMSDDPTYAIFMRREVTRERGNAIAIEIAVLEHTGKKITIREPWKELMILDQSRLNGLSFFQDGNFYTYNVVQPVSAEMTSWVKALAVINRNRPIGTYIHTPAFSWGVDLISYVPVDDPVMAWTTRSIAEFLRVWPGGRLDYDLYLGNYVVPPSPEVTLFHHHEITDLTPYFELGDEWTGDWDDRTWMAGQSVFADMGIVHTPA